MEYVTNILGNAAEPPIDITINIRTHFQVQENRVMDSTPIERRNAIQYVA